MTTGTSTQRKLKVVMNRNDAKNLGNSGYQLQVAKSVISSTGKCTKAKTGRFNSIHTHGLTRFAVIFNVIWQSKYLEPISNTLWEPVYAFNWTSQAPTAGQDIQLESQWTQCNIGQAMDIDQRGYFNPSSEPADPLAMKIGKNGYTSQADGGSIYIIIGIKNLARGFDPIFVDPQGLSPQMSGTWQPQEKLQWWYEAAHRTSTVLDTFDSVSEMADFTEPDPVTGMYQKESSYNTYSGKWTTKAISCKWTSDELFDSLADQMAEKSEREAREGTKKIESEVQMQTSDHE